MSSSNDSALPCLGAEAPIVVSGGLPYVDVRLGGAAKPPEMFLIDYATTSSTVGLDLVGSWGDVAVSTTRHREGAAVQKAGIIGTDVTSRVVMSIDYAHARAHRAERDAFCKDAELARAGFSSLPSTGFFTNDLSKRRPLRDVVAGGSSNVAVANVPTVPLRIGSATAMAQLDTGFADALVPFSINVNEAFLAEVMAKSPNALVRAADKDLVLSTCAGVSEPAQAYTLRPGAAVDFVGEVGQTVKSFRSATLFVKHPPESAKKCGGIGTWTVPAAQVGASFFGAFGLVVFDPFASRVWLK